MQRFKSFKIFSKRLRLLAIKNLYVINEHIAKPSSHLERTTTILYILKSSTKTENPFAMASLTLQRIFIKTLKKLTGYRALPNPTRHTRILTQHNSHFALFTHYKANI